MTVLDVIIAVGGLSEFAAGNRARLVRTAKDGSTTRIKLRLEDLISKGDMKQNVAMEPGDVLIKGGFPGHAMMVVDVVENQSGHKMVLLAQGFMPAQSIHIVKNPEDDNLSPWYDLNTDGPVITPGFVFSAADLHHW